MSDDERVGLLIDAVDATSTSLATATTDDGVKEDLEVGSDTAERRQRRYRASSSSSSSSSCIAVGVLTSLLVTGAAIGLVGTGVSSSESRSVFTAAALGDEPTSTSPREGRATERQTGRRIERRAGRAADRRRARRETKTNAASDAELGTKDHDDDDDNVGSAVFLTYSDKLTDGLCVGGETAAMRGIDLHMLGVSKADERFDESRVKNVKTKKLFAFLKALEDERARAQLGIDDSTIVSLADASDVLYFSPKAEIIESFREIERTEEFSRNRLVVFGAERNCWPWMMKDEERIVGGRRACEDFPADVGSSYRFLNSGSLIGRAQGVAALLRDVIKHMKTVDDDDQLVLAQAYARQLKGDGSSLYEIRLDHSVKLYQTAWNTALESTNFAQYASKSAYYDSRRARVVNSETHTAPAIVHFNGDHRNLLVLARHFMKNGAKVPEYAAIKDKLHATYPWFDLECESVIEDLRRSAASRSI